MSKKVGVLQLVFANVPGRDFNFWNKIMTSKISRFHVFKIFPCGYLKNEVCRLSNNTLIHDRIKSSENF